MGNRKHVKIRVAMCFDAPTLTTWEEDEIHEWLSEQGIVDAGVGVHEGSLAVSLVTSTNIMISLAGHLELMKVKEALEKHPDIPNRLHVTNLIVEEEQASV